MTNVFVTGISGSGKTTLCNALARDMPAAYVSVGEIACEIMGELGAPDSTIESTRPDQLLRGQRTLARRLADIWSRDTRERHWVFDGHLVLPGTGRPAFNVPDEVVLATGAETIALCSPPPDEVARRVAVDRRQRPAILRRGFAERAQAELERAEEIAARNRLCLLVWDGVAPFPVRTAYGRTCVMVSILLTNDDGIAAEGLQTLALELSRASGLRLAVVAPESNRSGVARSVSTGPHLRAWPVNLGIEVPSFAIDGTPVDAVRLARLGLIDGFAPDLVVSGINHGLNLGDDITYSGTVAAALEGVVIGLRGIAVSQQSDAGEIHFAHRGRFGFSHVAAFLAELLADSHELPLKRGELLNINAPTGTPTGVEVTSLARQPHVERLKRPPGAEREYIIDSTAGSELAEPGTDTAAVSEGRISITPLHFDLMDNAAAARLASLDLAAALARSQITA